MVQSLQSQVVIRYIRENPASTIDEVRMLAKVHMLKSSVYRTL